MIYILELWNAKQSWLDLSEGERGEYMSGIGPTIAGLLAKGVKVLTWSTNNQDTHLRADYDFFAVWTFPDQAALDAFNEVVEGAGWYNYFDQVNLTGNADSAENIIGKLIQL